MHLSSGQRSERKACSRNILPKTQLLDVMGKSHNTSNATAVANHNVALGGARI